MAGYFVRLIMAGLLTTLADAFPPGRVSLLCDSTLGFRNDNPKLVCNAAASTECDLACIQHKLRFGVIAIRPWTLSLSWMHASSRH
jgi:hypothetical protein